MSYGYRNLYGIHEGIPMNIKFPISLTLEMDDVEYLLSVLDEYPQDSPANEIREEILLQTYE